MSPNKKNLKKGIVKAIKAHYSNKMDFRTYYKISDEIIILCVKHGIQILKP